MISFGQVTHVTVFEGINTAPSWSPYLINTGNRSHMLNIVLSGTQCVAPQSLDASLEASFDNLSYTQFGPRILTVGSSLSASVMAVGAFPFIRVAIRSFDTVNCRLSAYYSATEGSLVSLNVNRQENVVVLVSNTTTGNSSRYKIYLSGGDTLSLFVRGPVNSPVYEKGTLNGAPFSRQLGVTNSSGTLTFNETVSVPGVYDTEVVIGPGVGNVRIARIVEEVS